jgi:hypothetical protein
MSIKAKHDAETSSRPILIGLGIGLCAVLLFCGATIALRTPVSDVLRLPAPLIPTAEYLLEHPAPQNNGERIYAYQKSDGKVRICAEVGFTWDIIVDGWAFDPDRWGCVDVTLEAGLHLVRAQARSADVALKDLRFYEWAFETQTLSVSTPVPPTEEE